MKDSLLFWPVPGVRHYHVRPRSRIHSVGVVAVPDSKRLKWERVRPGKRLRDYLMAMVKDGDLSGGIEQGDVNV